MADSDRVVAVCDGGPLDGVHLSAPLGEDGTPQPLDSRAPVCGWVYTPAEDVPVPDGLWFGDVVHARAVRYVPSDEYVPPPEPEPEDNPEPENPA